MIAGSAAEAFFDMRAKLFHSKTTERPENKQKSKRRKKEQHTKTIPSQETNLWCDARQREKTGIHSGCFSLDMSPVG